MPARYQEDESDLSYSGIYIRAERGAILATLGELRFTGWVGPQEQDWVLSVAGNPLGKIARNKRRFDDVTADVANTLRTIAIGVEVERDRRLQIVAYAAEHALPRYDSSPPEPDEDAMDIDDFGNPVMEVADTDAIGSELARLLQISDEEALMTLLEEDLGSSTSESERLLKLLRLAQLPTWLVSSDSLPRNVPGGPRKGEVIRLGAGKPGAQGRVNEIMWRPVRGRPKKVQ
ncbi:MAG: hypothetical protein ACK5KU_00030 [Beutenbergiaceae bacterium]